MSFQATINFRVLLVGLGVTTALFGPWWVPIICMAALAVRYPAWEVLLIGLLIDFVWLSPDGGMSLPLFTIGAVLLVWLLTPIRSQILTS